MGNGMSRNILEIGFLQKYTSRQHGFPSTCVSELTYEPVALKCFPKMRAELFQTIYQRETQTVRSRLSIDFEQVRRKIPLVANMFLCHVPWFSHLVLESCGYIPRVRLCNAVYIRLTADCAGFDFEFPAKTRMAARISTCIVLP